MTLLHKYKMFVYPILVFFILFFLLLIFNLFKSSEVNFIEKEEKIPIRTKIISPSSIKPEFLFFGRIIGKNEINIVSGLGGKVVFVSKKLFNSEEIKKGEILFTIDAFNYEQDIIRKSSYLEDLKIELEKTSLLLKESKKQFQLSQEDLQRKKKLFGNTVSQKALDDAELKVSKAKTEYSKLEFQLNSTKVNIKDAKANLNVAKKKLFFTKFRAPFPGKVSDNLIDLGSEIKSGEILAKLINTSELQVKFFVGEGSFAELSSKQELIGRKIKVRWRKSKFKEFYEAEISRIDSTIKENSAGLNMYAKIKSISTEDPIRPGVFVEVLLEADEIKEAISVPENAVYEEEYIYILSDNKPKRIEVKVHGFIDNELILTGDFDSGSQIVLTRLDSFQNTNNYYSITE